MSTNRDDDLDLVWGADGIAEVIGRTERQTFHMLSIGVIPVARKVGGRWCADRHALRAFFKANVEAA
jgi:hypothetical protein